VASKEVQDATGEAPSAAAQLAEKRGQLAGTERALAQAERAMNVQEVIARQNEAAVLRQFIERLTASAAVEAAAEATQEAAALDEQLRAKYASALTQLAPDIEVVRVAIAAMTDAVRRCALTWNQAARALFERELVQMRFGVDGEPLAVLPTSPLDAVTGIFWDAVDKLDRLCRKDSLPTFLSVASDTPDQLQAKRMTAAAQYVETYAQELKLSKDLVALFAKAGPVLPMGNTPTSKDDGAFIGGKPMPLPAGAMQSAIGPSSVWEPDTEREKSERDAARRRNARKQAAVARELGDEARTEVARREAMQGPLKGSNPTKGR
jgi:hypothetical protein